MPTPSENDVAIHIASKGELPQLPALLRCKTAHNQRRTA